jgi:hypothetical protein
VAALAVANASLPEQWHWEAWMVCGGSFGAAPVYALHALWRSPVRSARPAADAFGGEEAANAAAVRFAGLALLFAASAAGLLAWFGRLDDATLAQWLRVRGDGAAAAVLLAGSAVMLGVLHRPELLRLVAPVAGRRVPVARRWLPATDDDPRPSRRFLIVLPPVAASWAIPVLPYAGQVALTVFVGTCFLAVALHIVLVMAGGPPLSARRSVGRFRSVGAAHDALGKQFVGVAIVTPILLVAALAGESKEYKGPPIPMDLRVALGLTFTGVMAGAALAMLEWPRLIGRPSSVLRSGEGGGGARSRRRAPRPRREGEAPRFPVPRRTHQGWRVPGEPHAQYVVQLSGATRTTLRLQTQAPLPMAGQARLRTLAGDRLRADRFEQLQWSGVGAEEARRWHAQLEPYLRRLYQLTPTESLLARLNPYGLIVHLPGYSARLADRQRLNNAAAGLAEELRRIGELPPPEGIAFLEAEDQAGLCACCWEALLEDDALWTCEVCAAQQHAECFHWTGGCGRFACVAGVSTEE